MREDAAFGAASETPPKFLSETDPASRSTSARRGPAFYAYALNYPIDTDKAIILDVEATTAIRQVEMMAAKRMLERCEERHGLYPAGLAAGTAYGSEEMLGRLVEEKAIAPHIPVFETSRRQDGTFARRDVLYDPDEDCYICPGGKALKRYRHAGCAAKAAERRLSAISGAKGGLRCLCA